MERRATEPRSTEKLLSRLWSAGFEGGAQLFEVLHLDMAAGSMKSCPRQVGIATEKYTPGQLAVTPGAPGLLVVLFDTCWWLEMHNEPDIRFVYPETKRVRRGDDSDVAVHEGFLHALSVRDSALPVVKFCGDPSLLQPLRNFPRGACGGGVHDAGACHTGRQLRRRRLDRLIAKQILELLPLLRCGFDSPHFKVQIGTIGSVDANKWIAKV